MGRGYRQLTREDRSQRAQLQAQGHSLRQIAATLDRAPSTIAREVKRNGRSRQRGYQVAYAHQQAQARRWRGSKLERNAELREQVLTRLKAGWSPEQVAGRLARDAGRTVVSYETIYRFIDAQIRRGKEYDWRHSRPRAKAKRGRRSRKGAVSRIPQRQGLEARPPEVATRQTFGHWEADLMLFSAYGQAVLALHERRSRLLLAWRLPEGKAAEPIARAIGQVLGSLPAAARQSVTFDNGSEFARHYRLHDQGIATYFCDPHAPWQKGGVENGIGRLRRPLPRRTDLAALPDELLEHWVRAYNNTPRKGLNYQTPAEVFIQEVLRLECEFTFPLTRE